MRAVVVDVDASDASLVAKFAARGLVPGAELSVVRSGDPLLVFVEESRWALTRKEAEKISVVTLTAQPDGLFTRFLSQWSSP